VTRMNLDKEPRRRFRLGSVLWTGLGVLALYLLLRFVLHLAKVVILLILPVLAAGLVVQALPRTRISASVRLALGVLVFAGVYTLERQVPGLH
jgi:hypothetical protein